MDDLERVDARHLDLDPASDRRSPWPCGPATSSRALPSCLPSGIATETVCWPTGKTSRIGPFIIIGLVRLLSTTATPSSFVAHREIEEPAALDLDVGTLAERPAHGVGDEPLVVVGQHFPEDRADVPGDVDRAPAALVLAGHHGGAARRLAGIDLLHRQVGEIRDIEERLLGALRRIDRDQLRAADDALGAVEAGSDRMLAVERDVGVLDDAA